MVNIPMHLIAVSESWLTDRHSLNSYQIPGFNIIRKDREDGMRGGGVVIYYHESLSCPKIISKSGKKCLTEHLFVEFSNFRNEKLLIGVIYNHPKQNLIKNMKNILHKFSESYQDILILGDMNINILNKCSDTKRFESFIDSLGFKCTSKYPTNFANGSFSCIDLILSNNDKKIIFNDQLDISGISSHDLIFGSYDFKISRQTTTSEILIRNISRINNDALLNDARSLEWNHIFNLTDVNAMLHTFNNNLLTLLNLHAPKHKIKINDQRDDFKFSTHLQSLANTRDHYRSCWIRFKTLFYKNEFKKARNKFNNTLQQELRNHFERKFNPNLPTKILFSRLRKSGILNYQSNIEVDISSEDFNKYFSSTGNDDPQAFHTPAYHDGFSYKNVSENEVLSALLHIKSNAAGIDDIPINFIRILKPIILQFLTFIVNTCITKSIIPDEWKKSKILPRPKKSKPQQISDFRPISILPSASKILEIILKNQTYEYISSKSLISNYQSGFRKYFSTTTALINVLDNITNNIDNNEMSLLILLDFSKAFDTISHFKLLNKLKSNFNFSSSALNLLNKYLSGRIQMVEFNGIQSKWIPVHSGVPQGGVLSALLFTLFINDIEQSICPSKFHLYADDVQIISSCSKYNLTQLFKNSNHLLDNVSRWAKANLLELNPSKSEALLVSNKKIKIDDLHEITLNNEIIPIRPRINNLGFLIDSKLSFCEHANKMTAQIYYTLRNLWSSAKYMSTAIRRQLIISLIIPKFIYGAPLLISASKGAMRQLNLAFNSCARFVYRKKRKDRISSFAKQILGCNLNNYIKYCTCKLIFKTLQQKKPEYIYKKLSISNNCRSQYINQIQIATSSSKQREDSFFVQGLKLWNSLDPNIRTIRSLQIFEKRCFQFFADDP
jgi:hypothetical protein